MTRFAIIFMILITACDQSANPNDTTEDRPGSATRPSETREEITGFLVNMDKVRIYGEDDTLIFEGAPQSVSSAGTGSVTDAFIVCLSIYSESDFDQVLAKKKDITSVSRVVIGYFHPNVDGSFRKEYLGKSDLPNLIVLAVSDLAKIGIAP